MTTTSHFQTKPDYYESIEKCKESNKIRDQTNIRYKNFTQTHFTAGDEEQFQNYRYDKNGTLNAIEISLENNIFKDENMEFWQGYKDLEATNVLETFRYLFNKFKKGIFVKIVDNELKVFLPFSNINFVNEWSHNIKIDPKYNNLHNFIKYTNEMENRTFYKNSINDYVNTWYGNNCLVRYEYPIKETDTNISNIKNLLEELCVNRKIPDIEFFLNRRDFPLLTKNYTEPYYHLWNNMNQELVSHKYDKYIPILSMSKTDNFADVLIPSHEDWGRVQVNEGKYFPKCHINFDCNFNNDWKSKKSIAVFRGSSTGFGVDIETNNRLKISYLSTIEKNKEYIDAGITKWNTRPRKFINSEYLQTINVNTLPFGLVEPLTPYEQSNYKYIIHIDGHVSAFRLSYELNMLSVVLMVESEWKIWYSHLLKPYVHYIPVKSDLSDIIDIIKWCKVNDEKCFEIAKNAQNFYSKYLQKKSIFDYFQKIFVDLKEHTGTYLYNTIKPLDLQIKKEYKYLRNFNNENKLNEYSKLPCVGRTYGLLKGIELVIRSHKNIENYLEFEKEIFTNKLGKVNLFNLLGFKLSIKNTTDYNKSKEHIHETFIGLNCINKIVKEIPNFAYVFGMYKNKGKYNVITEYIKGQTLKDYISSENFSFSEYIFIILQICLALHVAQKMYCFVHNDLTPWNIILQRLKTPIIVDYVINHKKVIRIKTNIVPIIIDYGKSHVIYKDKHYGFINMFNFSTINDIFSILVTSIYQILIEKQLCRDDFGYLLKLSNFLCNSQIRNENFTNSKDLKLFLHGMKKYSNLITETKYDLEKKNPLDLFYYIRKNIRYSYEIDIVNEYNSIMNKGNSLQVYNYIISTNDKERLESYTNYFNIIKDINIDFLKDDLILTYYTIQNIFTDINYNYNIFLNFLNTNDIDIKKYSYINDIITKIKVYFNHKISKCKFNIYKIKYNTNFKVYNEDIFLLPDQIMLYPFNSNKNYFNEIKDITEYIILHKGYFKIKNRENIEKLSQNIFNFNSTDNLLSIAYNNTLVKYIKRIYNDNMKYIENISKNDKNIDIIYNKYNNILNKYLLKY